ncbi:MAG TPA: hypothetical protein VEY71_11410, partial [Chitinophagales bacterium]|nr:hypothetical protein [Chitinophagales bacterium]
TWNSTLANELTYYAILNTDSTWKSRDFISNHYAFVPVSVGLNVIDRFRLKVGLEAHGLVKYLVSVRNQTKSDDPKLATPVTFYNGSELRQLGYQRLGYAGGGGVFFAWTIDRVMPKIGAGYLMDLSNVYENGLTEQRFSHVYASASLKLMLHRQRGFQKHDRQLRW